MSVIALLAASPGLFMATSLTLGLVVGSFLNVVIYRLPIMLERQWRADCAELAAPSASGLSAPPPAQQPFNLLVPRSACPSCQAPISALQNVPLISWLVLRGRCGHCRAVIPARYPAVEALTAVLTMAVAWDLGFTFAAAAGMVLSWFLIALTFIDIDHQLLPDGLTLPLLWLGLFLSLLASPAAPGAFPVDLHASLWGAIAGYASLWSVYHLFRLLTGKEGMGYGDFKLFAALGAWLGWQMLLPIILLAASTGAVVGLGNIVLRGQSRSMPIPFGPFLAAAGWLMLMFEPSRVSRWFGLL